jgi:nucleotide-binding universal stress UspA family protein
MSHQGPIVVGFDGTPASEQAVTDAGELLGERPAVVVVVHKAGLGFELVELPAASIGLPPAPIDVRTAMEIDEALLEGARRMAEHGARLAREAGLAAEPLVVSDDPETSVSETLVDLARRRDAPAMVLGAHGHGSLGAALLGSVSRDVIRHAPCPVLVSRGPARRDGDGAGRGAQRAEV